MWGNMLHQPHKYVRIYYHFVWTTKKRRRIIDSEMEGVITKAIASKAVELGIDLISLGCVSDHVHVLVQGSTTIPPCLIAKGFKGSSSHLVNATIGADGVRCLYWQTGYAVLSVSPLDVPRVRRYVENQKARHGENNLLHDLEPKSPIAEEME